MAFDLCRQDWPAFPSVPDQTNAAVSSALQEFSLFLSKSFLKRNEPLKDKNGCAVR